MDDGKSEKKMSTTERERDEEKERERERERKREAYCPLCHLSHS